MLLSIQENMVLQLARLVAGIGASLGRFAAEPLTTLQAQIARLAVPAGVSQAARTAVKSATKSATKFAMTSAAPAALTANDQWSRVSGVLTNAIAGAREAGQLQSAATRQLDLAQYALYTLRDELSAVMSVPGRREPASVHVLDASPSRAVVQALAA